MQLLKPQWMPAQKGQRNYQNNGAFMNSNDIINNFINSLTVNKKSSENTLSAYRRDLENFFDYISLNNIDYTRITPNDVLLYKDFLTKSGKSASTVSRFMSSLRSFYKFLVSSSMCDVNPAVKVKNEKSEKKYFEVLTEAEIDTLLSQPDHDTYKGKRDKAILEILYATGLKVSELINLNVSDVNIKMGCVKCQALNPEKSRMILLYPKAIKAVSDYLEYSRVYFVSDSSENSLFVNTNGERMTRQGLWKLIKLYAEQAGINKSITPHTLRHSFATHLLENGADINDIKDILGHADISSTNVYSEFIKSKINTSYLRFNHRSN